MKHTKSQLIEAQILGTIAFSNDINASALDGELMKMLEGSQVGESIPLLKAWVRGWTLANLNAEVN